MSHRDDRAPARPTSHRRLTSDERFTQTRESLAGRRDWLLAAVERKHPMPGCLPLPVIELPSNPDDLTRLINHVCDNLFTEQGNRSQQWIDARARCTHLSDDGVNTVYELVYRWYQLACAARQHLDDDPLVDFAWSEDIFDHWVTGSPLRNVSDNRPTSPTTDGPDAEQA